jgi:hypothetical protein
VTRIVIAALPAGALLGESDVSVICAFEIVKVTGPAVSVPFTTRTSTLPGVWSAEAGMVADRLVVVLWIEASVIAPNCTFVLGPKPLPFTVSVMSGDPAVAVIGAMLAKTSLFVGTFASDAPASLAGGGGAELDPGAGPASALLGLAGFDCLGAVGPFGFGVAFASKSVGRFSALPFGSALLHPQSVASAIRIVATSTQLHLFTSPSPSLVLPRGRPRR